MSLADQLPNLSGVPYVQANTYLGLFGDADGHDKMA